MKILICVKQVPNTEQMTLNPVTGTLNRDNAKMILNPYDSYALAAAAKIKTHDPDTQISVVTMGTKQAETMLRGCLSLSADRAWLVSDPIFKGSDTLITSHILSKAILTIQKIEGPFDYIFCGKQSIDGETAQVGPQLAERLKRPFVPNAIDIVIPSESDQSRLPLFQCQFSSETLLLNALPPCLVAFTKSNLALPNATLANKIFAKKTPISVLTAEDLSIEPSFSALRQSPTHVVHAYAQKVSTTCKFFKYDTDSLAISALFDQLYQDRII